MNLDQKTFMTKPSLGKNSKKPRNLLSSLDSLACITGYASFWEFLNRKTCIYLGN